MGIGITELLIIIFFGLGGQTGLPFGMPPGSDDPIMSKMATEDCLFYTSWASVTAPNPEGNVTERWMASAEVQESFQKMKSALEQVANSGNEQEQAFGKLAFRVAEKCLTNACAFYVNDITQVGFEVDIEAGALITLGEDANELTNEITRILKEFQKDAKGKVAEIQVAGKTCHQIKFGAITATWCVVDDKYLALTLGQGHMQNLLANIRTAAPDWWDELTATIPVERTSNITWVNFDASIAKVRELATGDDAGANFDNAMTATGFANLKSAGWIAGMDDSSFICRGSIDFEGEPTGIFGVLGDEPLEPEMFGKIAEDRMFMTGVRLSAPKIVELFRNVLDANEWSRGDFDLGMEQLNGILGLDIEDDILGKLDQNAYLYGSINFTNPSAGWVLGIGASNEMDLAETYEKVNKFFKDTSESGEGTEFEESEVNGSTIYGLKDTRGWGMPNFSWTLADEELLISLDKSSLRRHLRRNSMDTDALVNNEWFSENAFAPPTMEVEGPYMVASLDLSAIIKIGIPLLATFGDDMMPPNFPFSFDDIPSVNALVKEMKPNITALYKSENGFQMFQRQSYPGGTPGTVVGAMGIGIFPASMQVRRSAMRTDGANRARQLTLAMHNYHDTHGALPARFSRNDDAEPLLSWRVHILPYLEEGDLYAEFHLDEPWDSEHNKALIARMPQCYIHPMAVADEGKTVFVVPAGEGSIMPDPSDSETPKGMSLESVVDGTSQTGLIFEVSAENAVTWTQPEDFDWKNIDDPVAALFGGWDGGGVNVALADGSVQHISREKLEEILDKLITVSDGEIIDVYGR